MFLPRAVVCFLRKRLPRALVLAQRRYKARKFLKVYDQQEFFAETPVDLHALPLFRRENFPASGPGPLAGPTGCR